MSKNPFTITVERNWDDNNYENYVNKHYIPKMMKRYYRKQKPFQINISKNVEISFEPFFQDHQSYKPQKEYKICRHNPTPSQIQKIKFLWKLDIYPYNQVEADIISAL